MRSSIYVKHWNKVGNGRIKSIRSQFFHIGTQVTSTYNTMAFMKKYGKIAPDNLNKLYMEFEKEMLLKGYTFPTKPSKDGYFRTYVKDGDKRKQLFAKSLEELKEKVYEFEREGSGKTFSEVYILTEIEREKCIIDPEKKISYINTKAKHNSDYNRFFLGSKIEGACISAISKDDIEEFITDCLSSGEVKQRAFVALRSILSSTFDYAYKHSLIFDNTYKRVDTKKFITMLCKPTPINKRAYSSSELIDILDCLHKKQKEKPSYIAPYAVECQILMGLRRGEVAPLLWRDVQDGYLVINKEQLSVCKNRGDVNRQVIVNHTKTGKDRIFPLVGESKEFIDKMVNVHEKYYKDSEYIFPSLTTSSGAISNEVIYKCYSKIVKNLGIKRDVVMGTHSFRRNAITDAVNNTGGNLLLVSELFGNSPEVIRKNYFTGIELDSAIAAIGKRKLTKS